MLNERLLINISDALKDIQHGVSRRGDDPTITTSLASISTTLLLINQQLQTMNSLLNTLNNNYVSASQDSLSR